MKHEEKPQTGLDLIAAEIDRLMRIEDKKEASDNH